MAQPEAMGIHIHAKEGDMSKVIADTHNEWIGTKHPPRSVGVRAGIRRGEEGRIATRQGTDRMG